MLLKVPGTTLVRDTTSMALINQDVNGLQNYMRKRSYMESQKHEINTIRSEVNSLKTDINEIKDLMKQLLEKG